MANESNICNTSGSDVFGVTPNFLNAVHLITWNVGSTVRGKAATLNLTVDFGEALILRDTQRRKEATEPYLYQRQRHLDKFMLS